MMDFFSDFRGLFDNKDGNSFLSSAFNTVTRAASNMVAQDSSGGNALTNNQRNNPANDLASTEKLLTQGFLDVGRLLTRDSNVKRTGEPGGSVDIQELEAKWFKRMMEYSKKTNDIEL